MKLNNVNSNSTTEPEPLTQSPGNTRATANTIEITANPKTNDPVTPPVLEVILSAEKWHAYNWEENAHKLE